MSVTRLGRLVIAGRLLPVRGLCGLRLPVTRLSVSRLSGWRLSVSGLGCGLLPVGLLWRDRLGRGLLCGRLSVSRLSGRRLSVSGLGRGLLPVGLLWRRLLPVSGCGNDLCLAGTWLLDTLGSRWLLLARLIRLWLLVSGRPG